MRTVLFYIPHELEILGIELPVFGYGWTLIVLAVFSVGLLVGLAWWKRVDKEALGYVPILAVLAAAIVFVVPSLEERQYIDGETMLIGLAIRGYGVMMLIGVVCAVALAAHRARRMGLDPEIIFSLAFWMFLAGIVGARLWFIVQYFDRFAKTDAEGGFLAWDTITSLVSVTQGGLVVYGGLIGGLIAGLIFLRRRKLPPLAIGDVIAPSMMVGLALGRVGCLLNGCCFGGVCEEPNPLHVFAVSFPQAQPETIRYRLTPQDSPPYEHQHSMGQLYWFRLGQDEQARPIVKHLDPQFHNYLHPTSDELRISDRIERINGQEVDAVEVNGKMLSPIDGARRLLAGSGPAVSIQTDDGRLVRMRISHMPERSRPVHPSQLYAAINAALIATFLWFYYPFRRSDGEVFALLLIVYPIARFLLEIIRADEPGQFGTTLTIAQWFSIVVGVTATGLFVYLRTRPAHISLPMRPPRSEEGGSA